MDEASQKQRFYNHVHDSRTPQTLRERHLAASSSLFGDWKCVVCEQSISFDTYEECPDWDVFHKPVAEGPLHGKWGYQCSNCYDRAIRLGIQNTTLEMQRMFLRLRRLGHIMGVENNYHLVIPQREFVGLLTMVSSNREREEERRH